MGLSIGEQFGLDEGRSYAIPGVDYRERPPSSGMNSRGGWAAGMAIAQAFGGQDLWDIRTSVRAAEDRQRGLDVLERLRRAEADRDDAQVQVRNLTAQVAELDEALADLGTRHGEALARGARTTPLIAAYFEWAKHEIGSLAEDRAAVIMIEASDSILPGDYE